ncbi:uncharacterized protein B0I36DRAFT_290617 [Microdochium trichocladiopsis]|uniref:Uncharacterized protein n=1 Tax=Microdochium trichocladiopsis TaxID=1682393 RepID=A0A9P8Y3R2_9PEZI|nr:uncharacterized protein B0I36DRAFT_290617 [Microdochium trichocladiopsis]KAH7029178.1 hypothetical protein B0I36DRAFT_290617 [Microdochium trichocladiopsis]
MASPAVVVPNGIAATAVHATEGTVQPSTGSDNAPPASPTGSLSAKRKRGDGPLALADQPASANGVASNPPAPTKIDKSRLQDCFTVLQRHDTTPSLLSRSISGIIPSIEPQAKRQKSEDSEPTLSIADKVAKGAYEDVETIVADVRASIQTQLAELSREEDGSGDVGAKNEKAIAETINFAQRVYDLFKRELNYPTPRPTPEVLQSLADFSTLQSNASGNVMLTVYGEAPRYRPLYSSLQQGAQPLREKGLPLGVKTTKALPYTFPMPADKARKPKTLGELFPPPRNLQSLQPPKAPKSSTRGVHVGWHRPELTEKSKYRVGSYFSQSISTGRWLDYSNAAPPQQIMTKQRERAMSLAGNKPSITELEASEMESLFRGAFSSFAPSKDDSAAMVSSGLVSQTIWWQKHGKRSFDRLVEGDGTDEDETPKEANAIPPADIDEKLIENAIENWDDSLVDPSLEQACLQGAKTQEEKDTDDILQQVSDMIQTLVSYQKNRNLTLPSAAVQSRYAADPAHSDMLTNGSPVQPDEEETATYDALKAQLSLIVQSLPPYAVARLNSDKLDELNISMRMEVKTDEYRGSMDEDEAAARARMASQAVAQPARPSSHRASGSYGQPYQNNRAPVANAQYYGGAQTPVRPGPMQRPPQSMPPAYNQRPPGYRQPNQYTKAAYNAQAAQGQPAYGQAGAYGTPPQNRQQFPQHAGYSNVGTPNTQPRFSAYQPSAQTPNMAQHSYQPQHQQGTPTHPQYNQYPNGAPPPRAVSSPHVPPQQPHMQPQHGFRPTGTPQQRQPSVSAQQPNLANPQARGYPQQGPMMPHQQHQVAGKAGSPAQFHNANQVEQAMHQGRVGPPTRASISAGHAAVPDMGAGTLGVASPGPTPHPQLGPASSASPIVNGGAAAPPTNGALPVASRGV